MYLTEDKVETKCGVREVITIVWVTYGQKELLD